MKLHLTLEDEHLHIERTIKIKMIGKKNAIMPDVTEIVFDMINTLIDEKPL